MSSDPPRPCTVCGIAVHARPATRHPVCRDCRQTTPHPILLAMTTGRTPR